MTKKNADDEALLENTTNICIAIQHIFKYLRDNVLPIADRHFKFALGESVFNEMATNNFSEGQNSRFDKYVGGSVNIKDLVKLTQFSLAYAQSAAKCYLHDRTSRARKTRVESKKEPDPSTKMKNWSLGAVIQATRRYKRGPVQDEKLEMDVDVDKEEKSEPDGQVGPADEEPWSLGSASSSSQ